MVDWLLAPVDPGRLHDVGIAVSWHARLMVLSWAFLAPLAILAARFFKVMPGQDWPRHLDNNLWWRTHWIVQSFVLLFTMLAVAIVYFGHGEGRYPDQGHAHWHVRLGYTVLALTFAQVLLGIFRGSKGGPTAVAADGSPRGDHYDLTHRRLMFEHVHKALGYLALLLAIIGIVLGLWQANAPRWMWLVLGFWWSGLAILAVVLQRRGRAIDTYQAIWGPGLEHPGNRRAASGGRLNWLPNWGMRRVMAQKEGESDVRRD